ncbi:MAG: UUP1 family membrane protein, partial [Alphaproteobacteria bacterium]|nr:UUP1 family membrane protein [Alphaproteobacteria bacterium]
MIKKFASIRGILSFFLFLSILYASYGIYYKIRYWGFSIAPKQNTNLWSVEAHISFDPTGDPIKVNLTTPRSNDAFKILEENIIAPDYKISRNKSGSILSLSSSAKEENQNLYYKIMLFDNIDTRGKIREANPKNPETPLFDEQKMAAAKQILQLAKKLDGDEVTQIIKLLNQEPLQPAVQAYLPIKNTQQQMVEIISELLALKQIPSRPARGLKLEESKKSVTPDLMLEAYTKGVWKIYNIKTGKKGLPNNFVLFQRGGKSLLDVIGGENSVIKFSILKSVVSSMSLAEKRAKLANTGSWFDYSIYNLPLSQQNTLKWLSIFPLAILLIVLMRNVVGVQTMGTFTPMLLSMALVKTGFVAGMTCFGLMIALGLAIRFLMNRFNLLLVPRISAVVIFVILIMQALTIIGFRMNLSIAQSAVFFPIIITAWIIERASITWEEDGALNAGKEIFFSLIVAIIVYFVVSSEYIRHIIFAFNE